MPYAEGDTTYEGKNEPQRAQRAQSNLTPPQSSLLLLLITHYCSYLGTWNLRLGTIFTIGRQTGDFQQSPRPSIYHPAPRRHATGVMG